MDTQPRQSSWAQVLYFRVYKEYTGEQQPQPIKVYNNGRQMCPVKVSIVVADNEGNPVSLPPADLEELDLFPYSDAPLPAEWRVDRTPGEYDWDESNIPGTWDSPGDSCPEAALPALLEPSELRQLNSVTFYVSTRANQPMQFAARIRLPGGSSYATTNTVWISDPDGSGDGNGLFNSSVLVRPTAFPNLPIENYGANTSDGDLPSKQVGNRDHFFWALEHILHVNLNGRFLPLKKVGATEDTTSGFAIYKRQRFTPIRVEWGISYYGQPGAASPSNFPLPPLNRLELLPSNSEGTAPSHSGFAQASYFPNDMLKSCGADVIANRNRTNVVIGMLVGNLAVNFLTSSGGSVTDKPTATLHIMDAYGNNHALLLSFGTYPNQIKISKVGAEAVPADGTEPRQKNDWRINTFNVTIFHTRVYHNGRQQARVRLWVSPMVGSENVQLTERQRQSIRVFDYDNPNGNIPIDSVDADYEGWSVRRTYNGYSPHPDAADIEGHHVPDQGPGEAIEFYISANRASSRNPIRLAFSIDGDGGSTWRTTGHVDLADGIHDYYPHLDIRENISVTAVPPVLYSVDAFHLDRRAISGVTSRRQRGVFNDMVTLSIVAGGKVVGIHCMTCTPAGMIHWINNLPETSNPCFTGYVPVGTTTVMWNPAVPIGAQPLPTIPAAQESKGIIVLCGRVDIPRKNSLNPPRGPINLCVVDEYGTEQVRQLAFVVGERDRIEIR